MVKHFRKHHNLNRKCGYPQHLYTHPYLSNLCSQRWNCKKNNNSYTNKEWKNEEGTQSTEPTHGRSVLQIKCASNEKQNYAQWILQIFFVFCTCFLPELSDATCLPSGCFVILHRIDNPNHEWRIHRKYEICNTQELLFINDPHTFSAWWKIFRYEWRWRTDWIHDSPVWNEFLTSMPAVKWHRKKKHTHTCTNKLNDMFAFYSIQLCNACGYKMGVCIAMLNCSAHMVKSISFQMRINMNRTCSQSYRIIIE